MSAFVFAFVCYKLLHMQVPRFPLLQSVGLAVPPHVQNKLFYKASSAVLKICQRSAMRRDTREGAGRGGRERGTGGKRNGTTAGIIGAARKKLKATPDPPKAKHDRAGEGGKEGGREGRQRRETGEGKGGRGGERGRETDTQTEKTHHDNTQRHTLLNKKDNREGNGCLAPLGNHRPRPDATLAIRRGRCTNRGTASKPPATAQPTACDRSPAERGHQPKGRQQKDMQRRVNVHLYRGPKVASASPATRRVERQWRRPQAPWWRPAAGTWLCPTAAPQQPHGGAVTSGTFEQTLAESAADIIFAEWGLC